MKLLLLTLVVCIAFIALISAVPIEEAIPQGFDGGIAASEVFDPSGERSFHSFHKLRKLKLLKKLLLLG